MKLVDIGNDQEVRIVGYEGGKGVQMQLKQLSLLPGDVVTVKKKAPLKGPILIEAHGRAVAIGRGVAAKVEVESVS